MTALLCHPSADTVASVATSPALEALRESGRTVKSLEASLEEHRLERVELLVAAYKEGWRWVDLQEAAQMTTESIRMALKRAGVLDGETRQRAAR